MAICVIVMSSSSFCPTHFSPFFPPSPLSRKPTLFGKNLNAYLFKNLIPCRFSNPPLPISPFFELLRISEAMDAFVGVNGLQKFKRVQRKTKKSVKVVYISSPMKVKTSASRFRSLVQELTGPNSDVVGYMEVHGGDTVVSIDDCDSKLWAWETKSTFDACDDWIMPATGEGSFGGMLQSFWHEPSQLGELTSIGAALN